MSSSARAPICTRRIGVRRDRERDVAIVPKIDAYLNVLVNTIE
jgi:hypothetical protein